MNISLCKIADAKELAGLIRRVIKESPYYSLEAKKYESGMYSSTNVASSLQDRNAVFLVGKDGARIRGFLHGNYDYGTFWINWIGVDVDSRRNGLAAALIHHLEALLKAKNIHKIWLDTRTTNKEAIRFFKKLGFKKEAELKNHWYTSDFYLWSKFV